MNYEIIQTRTFRNKAEKLRLSAEDLRLIELDIMMDPTRFPVLVGTNGLRKMRFAPAGMSTGKSGGIRVCYFVIDVASHIYLVTLFAKNEKDNLSPDDKKAAAALIQRTTALYMRKGRP